MPGEIAFTRMGASSLASWDARNDTAPLATPITTYPGAGTHAATPENSSKDPVAGRIGGEVLGQQQRPDHLRLECGDNPVVLQFSHRHVVVGRRRHDHMIHSAELAGCGGDGALVGDIDAHGTRVGELCGHLGSAVQVACPDHRFRAGRGRLTRYRLPYILRPANYQDAEFAVNPPKAEYALTPLGWSLWETLRPVRDRAETHTPDILAARDQAAALDA
jgi:hypothetical protein